MTSKITPRQLFFFLACIAPVGKIVLLPSQLAYYSENDLLFPAAVNLLIQSGVVFCALLAAKRQKTLFALLRNTFGTIVARIAITVYALFLFYAAFFPLVEQKLLVQSIFYDSLPSFIVFMPFFLFSAYLCAKPLRSLGRVWDILAPIAIVSYAAIIGLSAGNSDYGALLPVGASGAGGFFKGTAYSMSWFFDGALVLSLAGKLEYRKGLAWKGAVCYLVGAAATLFLIAVYYGIYPGIAVNETFAFSKISKFFAGINVLGRIDYLFIYALALVMAFYCAMPVQAGVELITDAYGNRRNVAPYLSVGINAVLLVLVVTLNYRFIGTHDLITQTLFWIFPLFAVAFPLLSLTLGRRAHE